MSDLESLFLVVALLYLLECGTWIPRGGLAFVATLAGRARMATPSGFLSLRGGGLVWSNPLSLPGRLFRCGEWPVSVTPGGIAAPGRFLGFEDLSSIEPDGRTVLANGEPLATALSARHAAHLCERIRRLRAADPAARAARIEAANREAFDADAIAARLADLRGRVRAVRGCGIALFLFFFALAPAAAWREGLVRAGLPLLGGLLALWSATALSFFRAHRGLFPEESGERRTQLFFLAAAPVGAIRAADALSRDLLAEFHPVAVAGAVCAPSQHLELARHTFLALRYTPPPEGGDDAPRRADAWSRAALLRSLEGHLRSRGIDPQAFLEPPRATDPASRSYCPRCRGEFVVAAGICADCSGVSLLPL